MTDLIYYQDGMFISFIPMTNDGDSAWNEMAKNLGGVAAVFIFHKDAVLKQLRDAGYKVRKRKKSDMQCDLSDDELLKELMA